MLAAPIIVRLTFVLASHWNYIEWQPIENPDIQVNVKRSPEDWPAVYYGIPQLPTDNFLTDTTADPKAGHYYSVCASLGGETACSAWAYIGPSPVSEPAVPPQPKIDRATPAYDSIAIHWVASQIFSSYNIIWGRDGGSEGQVAIKFRGSDGSWRADNLQPGTMYHFRVEGCVGGLVPCSGFPPDVHVSTLSLPVPTITAHLVEGGGAIQLDWQGVPGATRAQIRRWRSGNQLPDITVTGPPSGRYTDHFNLAPGSAYGYAVLETLGNGFSTSSRTVYIPDVLGKPFWPISTACWGEDRLDVTFAGSNHDIYRQAWDVDRWLPGNADWQWLGNWTTGSPVEVATPPLGGNSFVLGKDNQPYTKDVAGGYAPQDWEPLGGQSLTTPVGISATPGRLDVFIVGTDHRIYQKIRVNGSWQPSQTDWSPLGGYSLYAPTVISSGPNHIDLFIAGADQAVYGKTWDGNQWLPSADGWTKIGGTIIGPPSAVSWGPGHIDLVVRGTDSSVYKKTWDNGAWYPSVDGWEALGGTVLGPPTLVSWGFGRLDLFVVGTDTNIYHKDFDGTRWVPSLSSWEPVGGTVYSDGYTIAMPSAVSWAPGRLDLFVMGTDSAVYQKALVGNQWIPANGWVAHGGQVMGW